MRVHGACRNRRVFGVDDIMSVFGGLRTVAVLSDAESFNIKLVILRWLSSNGYDDVLDLGVNGKTEEYDYRELAARAANAIREARCVGCIAVSLTGNGIQMYANEHDGIVAAPCDSLDSAKDAVKEIAPNMCDIYSRIPEADIPGVVITFVSAFKKRFSASNGETRGGTTG